MELPNSGVEFLDALFNSREEFNYSNISTRSHNVWQHKCKMDSAYIDASQKLQTTNLEVAPSISLTCCSHQSCCNLVTNNANVDATR